MRGQTSQKRRAQLQLTGRWSLMKNSSFDLLLLFFIILLLMIAGSADAATSSRPVVVAVIDTGVDADHPALKNQLWTNPGESGRDSRGRDKATNGIDDDRNGFIDDVHGWSFVDGSNNLSDQNGHGTHIAGIIAGKDPRPLRPEGADPSALLLILKYYDTKGPASENLRHTVEAIRYAVKMGVDIINYSSGGPERSLQEEMAIREAQAKGILFVAATGNEGRNLDQRSYYPAGYGLTNILSVTAHDPAERLLATSNFGQSSVDLAAPGFNILSTLPGGGYGTMTGTSQATAYVTGVAARLISKSTERPRPEQVIAHLVGSGLDDSSLWSKTRYHVRINLQSALSQAGVDQTFAGSFASQPLAAKTEDYF